MLEATDELKVKPIAVQRAFAILDTMLKRRDMGKETLELLTMASLLVAVKLEEVEIHAIYALLK